MFASEYNNGCTPKLCMQPFTDSNQTGVVMPTAKLHRDFQIIHQMVASNYQRNKQQQTGINTIKIIT